MINAVKSPGVDVAVGVRLNSCVGSGLIGRVEYCGGIDSDIEAVKIALKSRNLICAHVGAEIVSAVVKLGYIFGAKQEREYGGAKLCLILIEVPNKARHKECK